MHAAASAVFDLPDARVLRHLPDAARPGLSAKRLGMPLVIEVAAGLIRDAAGRYLITRRRRGSHLPGLWEFPGGKLEAGETPQIGLRRELEEELTATFAVGELVETVRWEYPDRVVVLHFFDCHLESGAIVPREEQAMEWVEPARLGEYDFPPADRELIERLGRQRPRDKRPTD